jgi:hypothetical protein
MTNKIPRDWHDVRNATLDPGGRDDIPRPRRACGGKIEMRPPGGADVDADQPRRPRRATGARSRKSKSLPVAGETAKHRVDRAPRRKQKLADGGVPGGASGMPYGGNGGYVPAVALPTARFSAPAVPNTPDNTPQMLNTAIGWLKNNNEKDDDSQGLISGIKLPGGGTIGDATQDALQDFREDTLGLDENRGGAVRKRGRRSQKHRQHKRT